MTPPSSHGLAAVQRVRVGSLNEPKIEAVRRAIAAFVEAPEVEGMAVASGVPEQPVGFAEIAKGARNRANAAYAAGACDLAVGIEDGLVVLEEVSPEPFNVGCAAVTDGSHESLAFSSAFAYPHACAQTAMREREPIGDLFDQLWRQRVGESSGPPSALSVGNVGKLSLGVLPRAEYARHAVLCALLRFLHPDLYLGAETAAEVRERTGLQSERGAE